MANIIINPGFEEPNPTNIAKPLGWTLAQYTYNEQLPYTGVFPIWDTLQARSGTKSVKIDLTLAIGDNTKKRGGQIQSSNMVINPSFPYKLSFYIKAENLGLDTSQSNQLPYVRIQEYNSSNTYLKFTDYKMMTSGTYDWTFKEFVFYPRTDTDHINVQFIHTWNNGIVWLDDFYLDIAPANCDFTWTPVSPTINQIITLKPLDNSLVSHVWKINDVQWSILSSTTVQFNAPGIYTIQHLGSRTDGETCVTSKVISICPTSSCAIASWNLDETGTTVTDSINEIVGTCYGTTSVPGISGNAIQFNGGSNSYINMGNPTLLNFGSSNFSVSTFVKTTATAQKNIIEKRLTGTIGNPGFAIVINSSGGLLVSIQDNVNKVTSTNPDLSLKPLNDGNWHHIAVVFDRINKKILRYVDGYEVGATMDIYPVTGSINTTQSFEVGRYFGYPYTPKGFIGTLENIKVWNRTLSANEVLTEANIILCTTPICSFNISY